jgi:hypothetical protein
MVQVVQVVVNPLVAQAKTVIKKDMLTDSQNVLTSMTGTGQPT